MPETPGNVPGADSARERRLLWLLAAIQFSNTLDFLIMMPLGPQYMRVLAISPKQFGWIVSTYAIAAGASGLLGGLLLDRFNRRKALLFLFSGFALGTFFCAVAPGYLSLIAARGIAGGFGGLTGATILAVIADVVPEARRGRAMAMVMSSFSIAMIFGVPAGLSLANYLGWHAPFAALTAVSVAVLGLAFRILPSLDAHLSGQHSPVRQLKTVLTRSNHLRAMATIALLTFSGFFVVPYLSPYLVSNVGIEEAELPYIYFVGGCCTLFTMNAAGRLADRFGNLRMFVLFGTISGMPVIWLTNLGSASLSISIVVVTLLMIFNSARYVPAMALVSGSVQPRYRGSFMSLISAVQNFAAGCASFVGGLILGQSATGQITGYQVIGGLSVLLTVLAMILAVTVKAATTEEKPVEDR